MERPEVHDLQPDGCEKRTPRFCDYEQRIATLKRTVLSEMNTLLQFGRVLGTWGSPTDVELPPYVLVRTVLA